MNPKVYEGHRLTGGGGYVTVEEVMGTRSGPFGRTGGTPLRHVVVHSPDGFEWGYGGSGPADLALAILCDHFGYTGDAPPDGRWSTTEARTEEEAAYHRAWALHQYFKAEFLIGWHGDWYMTTQQIEDFVLVTEAAIGG